MIEYPNIHLAKFLQRNNRFVAVCRLVSTNEEVVVHVKNTGRCKELLLPNVTVALSYQPSLTRKTDYDLIAVKKKNQWINIDSQVPNAVAEEGLSSKVIHLPQLKGNITNLKREVTFKHSRFDIYVETDRNEKAIVEVKGMTLENQGVGAFPDAPTSRGLKHVEELIEMVEEGYHVYLLFVVQMNDIKVTTIHKEMDAKLYEAIKRGIEKDLQVIAYTCFVTQESIEVKEQVPFDMTQVFLSPNK